MAVAALLLAGCFDMSGDRDDATVTESSAPATPTEDVAPAVPPDAERETVLRTVAIGVVQAGVESGCLLLVTDQGRTYLLLGGDQNVLAVGARVRVVGQPAGDEVTTCQQGEPLRVISAAPAP